MRRAHVLTLGCLAASLPLAGCLEGGGGTPGDAGAGGFHYECVAWGDPVCDGEQPVGLFDPLYDEASRQEIPVSIAVGSAFGVRFYDAHGTTSSQRRPVEAAATAFLSELPEDDAFVAVRSGSVALLAQNGAGGVVDLVHIRLEEPQQVDIVAASTALEVGDEISLTTEVFGASRQLGGALPHTWTLRGDGEGELSHPYDSSDDALTDDHVTFRALTEGTVTVSVEVAEGVVGTLSLRITGPAQ